MDASVINVIALTAVGGAAFFYVLYRVVRAAVRDGTLQAQERRSTLKRPTG
jgi:hypothetical protein